MFMEKDKSWIQKLLSSRQVFLILLVYPKTNCRILQLKNF